jgi:hypothetical protein
MRPDQTPKLALEAVERHRLCMILRHGLALYREVLDGGVVATVHLLDADDGIAAADDPVVAVAVLLLGPRLDRILGVVAAHLALVETLGVVELPHVPLGIALVVAAVDGLATL